MSATSVRLLQAAAEVVGGEAALAQRLDIRQTVLGLFMADRRELPDALLLRAVDIILADRQSHLLAVPRPAANTSNDVTFQSAS